MKESRVDNKKVKTGRPRILVNFATLLRMRDLDNLGWSRMAQAYMEMTGRHISRDTIKRRYLEAKSLKDATIKKV